MNKEEKIGMYTKEEIFDYMTKGEGSMLGRSMCDSIMEELSKIKNDKEFWEKCWFDKCERLKHELSIANDKLKRIEEYIYGHKLFGMRYGKTLYRESLINILSIIKGDD